MRLPAKLIGGRFDGDSGTAIVTQVPEFLWAYACPHAALCGSNGIHWAFAHNEERHRADAEMYVHTGFDGVNEHEMPVAIYVWHGAADPSALPGVPELANA